MSDQLLVLITTVMNIKYFVKLATCIVFLYNYRIIAYM